jgi:hypothetical protein
MTWYGDSFTFLYVDDVRISQEAHDFMNRHLRTDQKVLNVWFKNPDVCTLSALCCSRCSL